eukprot:4360531-Pleurochrysis_carterae.AAC.1
MDSPPPIIPTFSFPSTPASSAASGPTTRSAPDGATPAAAAPTSISASGAPTVSSARTLTADKKEHFVISPEQLASVDKQLTETIVSTITSPATRPSYRVRCQNSGRA